MKHKITLYRAKIVEYQEDSVRDLFFFLQSGQNHRPIGGSVNPTQSK